MIEKVDYRYKHISMNGSFVAITESESDESLKVIVKNKSTR